MDTKALCQVCQKFFDKIDMNKCQLENCETSLCSECIGSDEALKIVHHCEDYGLGCEVIWCLKHNSARCEECGIAGPRCRECSDYVGLQKRLCIDCVNGFTDPMRIKQWETWKATGRLYPSIKKAKLNI